MKNFLTAVANTKLSVPYPVWLGGRLIVLFFAIFLLYVSISTSDLFIGFLAICALFTWDK